MFAARQVNGQQGCRGGDSGGPVFALNSDYSQVIARGIINGCNGGNGGDYMNFQDFYSILTTEDIVL
jgi:hypothetical protein